MALIGTIRKNGWILILMMALALGGFILMDIVSNSSRYSAADLNTMGKVNGETISRDEFDRYEKAVFGNSADFQRRASAWNYFLDKTLVNQIAEPLGLGVGKDELLDLEFGANPSPMLAQRQITPEVAQQVKGMIDGNNFTDPNARMFWSELEKEVVHERTQAKLMAMISKGVYAPNWLAESAYNESNGRRDFLYVRVPFEKVAEADVKVTDADLAAYLKAHEKQYYQYDETRIANYVEVSVVPTATDTADAKATLAKLAEGFASAKDDSLYVQQNQGKYDSEYKKKDALPAIVADDLNTKPYGTVVGPYLDNNSWNLAKIIDRKAVPDSVRARHILIKGGDSEKTVDSLKNLVDTGKARFDSLAMRFGTDGTAPKGGDLGWFAQGQMVAEFNDMCFNKAEQGKTYKVKTQFGWHLLEVTGKKFLTNASGVKFATISQRIAPSNNTQQAAKDRAIQLTTSAKTNAELEAKAKEMGMTMQSGTAMRANDYYFGNVAQGNTAREIVRWAFEEKTKVDQVRKDIFIIADQTGGYFDSKYVVTCLKSISPKGAPTVEGLRPQIEPLVKNQMKAKIILDKLQNVGDLAAVASQFQVTIDTASAITLASGLPAGNEPKVVGTGFGLANGAVSKPIEGQSGVYVVKAISEKPQDKTPPDLTPFRRQATSSVANSVRARMMSFLRRGAEVMDNRSRFF